MGEAVRDESGAVIEVRGAFQDISGRKTMEAELLCAHKEMTQLMETLPSFLISLDKAGRVVRWNREAGRLFGLEGAAVRGRLLAECNVSWKWPVVERALSQALEDGESVRLDDQPFTHLDGTPGYLGMTVNNIEQADNGHQCILIMGRDITRVKMLESQLVQAQKMEAIGQLSAGIAHEINTPIQFVGNNLSFLKDACGTVHELLRRYAALCDDCRKLPEMADKIRELDEFCRDKELGYLIEETSTSIQEIAAGVERVAGIVRSMRMVSHPGRQEMALVDLNAVVGTVVDITRHEWKNVLEMETRLQPDLPMVLCLVTEIYQALLNIVVNAIYAVTEMVDSGRSSRGRITISTRQDGNWAEIRIADTGSGIAPEIQDRIFDPFFTTKEVGEGTGQGLPIAHTAIVKQHGGMLFFESKPGQGTTFIVRLPMESEG